MYQHKKNGYIISAVPNDSGVSTYWISKEGNTDAYYCFSASDDTERNYQIQNGFDSYISMYEHNHARLFGTQTQPAPLPATDLHADLPDGICATCGNRSKKPGYLGTHCLACRHAYFEGSEAYEHKADYYIPEGNDDHE